MESGRKKHLVTILRPRKGTDKYGEEKPAKKVFGLRLNVQIISANTVLAAGASLTSEYISAMGTYDRRLNIHDIFRWKGNDYKMEMIKPDEDEIDMIVTAVRQNSV